MKNWRDHTPYFDGDHLTEQQDQAMGALVEAAVRRLESEDSPPAPTAPGVRRREMDLFRRCQTCGGEGRGTVTVTQPDGTEMEHVCPDCDFEGYVPVEIDRAAMARAIFQGWTAGWLDAPTCIDDPRVKGMSMQLDSMTDAVLALLLRGDPGGRE